MLSRIIAAVTLMAVACGHDSPSDPLPVGSANGGTPGTPSTPATPETPGTPATSPGHLVSRSLADGGASYPYQVFVPANYDASRKYPVVLALSGSAEKGNDGQKMVNVGLGLVVKAQASTFPAIVVFPQIPAMEGWDLRNTIWRTAIATLDAAMREFNGDPARVYLTGLSLGGDIGYELAYRNPTRFAAFVPIAGAVCAACVTQDAKMTAATANQMVATTLKALPIWDFQGSADTSTPVTMARAVAQAFQNLGAPFRYTEYPNAGHNVWDTAYASPDLYAWLWAQHR